MSSLPGDQRCYRYGQTSPVEVTVVWAEEQKSIFDNVIAKEQEAQGMANHLVAHVAEFEKAEIGEARVSEFVYAEDETQGEGWTMKLGDSSNVSPKLKTSRWDCPCSVHRSSRSTPTPLPNETWAIRQTRQPLEPLRMDLQQLDSRTGRQRVHSCSTGGNHENPAGLHWSAGFPG